MKTVALIMAGGRGERFYPASRINYPKQFLCLTNDGESMIQKTVNRLLPIINIEDIFILTNEMYKNLVHNQLPSLPMENIVMEPCSKNTAPAIELGVEMLKRKYDDSRVIVLPSDHLIKDENEFRRILSTASEFAEKNKAIVTVGITPNEPNTGYGYIKLGNGKDIYKVNRFVEKPNLETAKKYLSEGGYVWNAGMFIFNMKDMDEAFKKYLPEQHKILTNNIKDFDKVESISVDYGIMEKADNIYVIPGDFGWDDVGSWLALERINKKDNKNNVLLNKDCILIDSENVTIKGTDKKLIATVGMKDVVIVETDDVIAVLSKEKVSDIKSVIQKLKEEKKDKYL